MIQTSRIHGLWSAAVAVALSAPALVAQARGVVFDDRNENGVRDPGEPGLANVAVSNQDEVVMTGADGAFALVRSGTGIVFVSVPDGRRSVGPFWRRLDGSPPAIAFPLAGAPASADLTFVHASDTHIAEPSLPRTRRLRQLVDSIRPAFLLVTGDLIRDALRVGEAEARGLYELYVRETSAMPVPVWSVPGNHELFGIERHLSLVSATNPLYGRGMYRRHLGPDYYSFTQSGVHFVGLNTADHEDLWYYGHVDSLQLEWLRRDLARLPAGTPVVTFNHIPLASAAHGLDGFTDDGPAPSLIRVRGVSRYRHVVSNTDSILAIVGHRRLAIALGGHMHRREALHLPVDGALLRFHQAAAVVAGAVLAGVRAPSGITVYRVRGGRVDDGTFVPLP
ncbi:MAG: metallophosphoesterase [Gemmatimonadales bacterium]